MGVERLGGYYDLRGFCYTCPDHPPRTSIALDFGQGPPAREAKRGRVALRGEGCAKPALECRAGEWDALARVAVL